MKSKSISPAARCILLLQGFLKKKCPVLRFYTPKHFQLFNLCLFFLAMELNRECWNCYKAWLEQAKRKLLVLRVKKKKKNSQRRGKTSTLNCPMRGPWTGWLAVCGALKRFEVRLWSAAGVHEPGGSRQDLPEEKHEHAHMHTQGKRWNCSGRVSWNVHLCA